jgi:uncharacterized membrane protein YhhN
VQRDRAALAVALGAGFFMLSDSLLATNKFVSPLPMPQVWVLGTYYAAQVLIVAGMLRGRRDGAEPAALTAWPAARSSLADGHPR